MKNMGAMEFTLKDGESWEDILTVRMTREQWAAALSMCIVTGTDTRDLYEQALRDGDEGNMVAIMVAIAAKPTVVLQGEAIRQITEVLMPEVAAEVKADIARDRARRFQAHPQDAD